MSKANQRLSSTMTEALNALALNATGTSPYRDLSAGLPADMADNWTLANGSSNSSETTEKTRQELLKQPLHMVVILTLAYTIVFFLAIVNNTLVVCVICRNPQMRTVTNYFLANLAIADITVSFIVLPITLLSNLFTGRFTVYLTSFLFQFQQYTQ